MAIVNSNIFSYINYSSHIYMRTVMVWHSVRFFFLGKIAALALLLESLRSLQQRLSNEEEGDLPRFRVFRLLRKTRVAYVCKSLMRKMKPFFVPEGARSWFVTIVPVLANKCSRNLVQKRRNSFSATVVLRHRKMSRLNL